MYVQEEEEDSCVATVCIRTYHHHYVRLMKVVKMQLYTEMSSKRQAYTAGEKLAVIKYAEAHGNRAASRHFDGEHSSVAEAEGATSADAS